MNEILGRIMAKVIPVILAGGSGTRLWPESRNRIPKHLAPIMGDRSLLQTTAERVMALAASEAVVCVGAESQAVMIERQLGNLNRDYARHCLFEPCGRNTAAAIDLAARYVASRFGGDAIMWVCPSDHVINNVLALHEAVGVGLDAAASGKIVTFGIEPYRPETGYGYIQVKSEAGSAAIFEVAQFVEKPPLEQAEAMLEAGGFLWNSGMFLLRADTLSAAMAQFEPEIADAVTKVFDHYRQTQTLDPALYGAIKSMPVDKAVMERTQDIMVVPCDPDWSDVGGWQAIWEISDKDGDGNAIKGDVLLADAQRNVVRAGSRLVALAGVSDLAVIEVADAVLVARRDAGDEIRRIVGDLSATGRFETVDPSDGGYIVRQRSLAEDTVIEPGRPTRIVVLVPGISGLDPNHIIQLDAGSSFTVQATDKTPTVILEIIERS